MTSNALLGRVGSLPLDGVLPPGRKEAVARPPGAR